MKRPHVIIFLITSLCCLLIALHGYFVVFNWSPRPPDASRLAPGGSPLGADFSQYYAAASLALAGRPGQVYGNDKLTAEIARVTGAQKDITYVWFYPPPFLLMLAPLALLPCLAALACWLAPAIQPKWRTLQRRWWT